MTANARPARYSYWQVLKIRAALIDQSKYGDDGRGMSDQKLAGDISAYAEVRSAAAAKARGEPPATAEIAVRQEAIRRFKLAEYIDKRTGRIKEPDSLDHIALYLTEVDAIQPEELERIDTPYLAPLRLMAYLDSNPVPVPTHLEGVYRAELRTNDQLIRRYISIVVPEDGQLFHVEEVENTFEHRGTKKKLHFTKQVEKSGWGLLTPEDYMLIFLKYYNGNRNQYYFSFLQIHDFHARSSVEYLFLLAQSEINETNSGDFAMPSISIKENEEYAKVIFGYFSDIMNNNTFIFEKSANFSLHERSVLDKKLQFPEDRKADSGLTKIMTGREQALIKALLASAPGGVTERSGYGDRGGPNGDNKKKKKESNMAFTDYEGLSPVERRLLQRDPRFRLERQMLNAVWGRGTTRDFEAVIAAGADVNYADPRTGETVLHAIAASRARYHLKILLRQPGVKYWVRDADGQLPSTLANMTPEVAMGRLLMMKEAAEARQAGMIPRRLGDVPIEAADHDHPHPPEP